MWCERVQYQTVAPRARSTQVSCCHHQAVRRRRCMLLGGAVGQWHMKKKSTVSK
jgi:hypothetical protein